MDVIPGKENKMKNAEFSDLVGKTLISIEPVELEYHNEEIIFTCSDGMRYCMTHIQDCCESVSLIDTDGDLQSLIGEEIVVAEERISHDEENLEEEDGDSSETWTFYTLRTNKDSVTMRWYGTSNGYYSEAVDFYQIE